jgi:hypothetical protein
MFHRLLDITYYEKKAPDDAIVRVVTLTIWGGLIMYCAYSSEPRRRHLTSFLRLQGSTTHRSHCRRDPVLHPERWSIRFVIFHYNLKILKLCYLAKLLRFSRKWRLESFLHRVGSVLNTFSILFFWGTLSVLILDFKAFASLFENAFIPSPLKIKKIQLRIRNLSLDDLISHNW